MKYYQDQFDGFYAVENNSNVEIHSTWTELQADDPVVIANTTQPPYAPQIITALQARLALNEMGIRTMVEGAVLAASQDVKDFYEFASEWHRDNIHLLSMAAAIGMSAVDIDNFFILASAK